MTTPAERWAWRAFAVLGALAVVGAAAASNVPALLGSTLTGSPAANREAPCLPGRAVPILASPHISPAQADVLTYNSTPPTSGPHYAFTVAPGIYNQPISDPLAVHALEHGHVIVQYAQDLPATTIDELKSLVRTSSNDAILAPRPNLERGIAITAWGRLDLLDSYQPQRISLFIDSLSNRYNHGWTSQSDCPADEVLVDDEPAGQPLSQPTGRPPSTSLAMLVNQRIASPDDPVAFLLADRPHGDRLKIAFRL